MGLIPGLERSHGGGHGNPLQYSCLENPMDRGAWRAIVHVVAKSGTRLKQLSTHMGLMGHNGKKKKNTTVFLFQKKRKGQKVHLQQ